MIKSDEQSRGKRKIDIIENIFISKDNTIRSTRKRSGKSIIERPIQLLYSMVLLCDSKTTTTNTQDDKSLNVNEEKFRPKWSAAAVVEQRIREIRDDENQ